MGKPVRRTSSQVVVERDQPGRPHQGKTFAAVHAHLDDVPYCAAGLCAKLIGEGYQGYLIRTSNDEKSGGQSAAKNILSNEQDHYRMAKALGFADVYDLYYQDHEMNDVSALDIRGRLIFLLRALKIDTVISFHPETARDAEPDHVMTARAVDEACAMCASPADFPEHAEGGFASRTISETYWFHGGVGDPYNRVVDISAHIEKKIDAIVECRSRGGGDLGSKLRARLAGQGKRLPILGSDDRTADREYVRAFLLDDDRAYGKSHRLAFAERFYYTDRREASLSKVQDYVAKNTVPL